MNFENLSDELKAKAQACKTPEDILALAKEHGYELSDDELDSLSGAGDGPEWNCDYKCDKFEVDTTCYTL